MESHDSLTPNVPSAEPTRRHVAWNGAAVMVVVIIGFYVLREHWGQTLGFAPYLLLLACPLMHVFMHRGHGHGHHHDHDDKPQNT